LGSFHLGAGVLVVLALAGGAQAQADVRMRSATAVSSNWAGYVVRPLPKAASATVFTSVRATWKVPRVRCSAPPGETSVAVWVGLGGFDADAGKLTQIGTAADCTAGGKAAYHAWFEVLPAPAAKLRMAVRPGDRVTASVELTPTGAELRITNETTAGTVVKRPAVSSGETHSAEWIVEAPSRCGRFVCRVQPLANFGSVTFTGATAIGDEHAGTIADRRWSRVAIRLVPGPSRESFPGGPEPEVQSPHVGASAAPHGLTAHGSSFAVDWHPARPSRAATSGSP
jgi:hypothetical protein